MVDRSFKPTKDQRLGKPLPYQLPNPAQAHQAATYCKSLSFLYWRLIPTAWQISCVLLTRAPRSIAILLRLTCMS